MKTLDEFAPDVEVAWFGKPWDDECTEAIRIEVPEGYFCNLCITEFTAQSSGTAARSADHSWNYFHADCWGEVVVDAQDIIRDVLGN